MPYIPANQRAQYDDLINGLFNRLEQREFHTGHLNYIISSLVRRVIDDEDGYEWLSSIGGVLADVRDEFYRTVMVPYELTKIEENGDI